jgi:hypothetical protein
VLPHLLEIKFFKNKNGTCQHIYSCRTGKMLTNKTTDKGCTKIKKNPSAALTNHLNLRTTNLTCQVFQLIHDDKTKKLQIKINSSGFRLDTKCLDVGSY